MNPVNFLESNSTYGSDAKDPLGQEILDLHLWRGNGQFVSLWKPTWRERFSIFLYGRVWLNILGSQPPVYLRGCKKFFTQGKEK